MQTIELIQYKWDHGIYDLQYMVNLVYKERITKEQFFDITRYNFDGITENRNFN